MPEGDLLLPRPLAAGDFEELYSAASDPLIWALHPGNDRYKPEVFRVFFDEGLASGGALAVLDRTAGKMVGTSRYADAGEASSTLEIGWPFLTRPHWGGVYNCEMKRLMLSHAFRSVKTVIFLVGPGNLRSRRAVEKIGGMLTGTRPAPNSSENLVYEVTG